MSNSDVIPRSGKPSVRTLDSACGPARPSSSDGSALQDPCNKGIRPILSSITAGGRGLCGAERSFHGRTFSLFSVTTEPTPAASWARGPARNPAVLGGVWGLLQAARCLRVHCQGPPPRCRGACKSSLPQCLQLGLGQCRHQRDIS